MLYRPELAQDASKGITAINEMLALVTERIVVRFFMIVRIVRRPYAVPGHAFCARKKDSTH
jgi:hypothetical protein